MINKIAIVFYTLSEDNRDYDDIEKRTTYSLQPNNDETSVHTSSATLLTKRRRVDRMTFSVWVSCRNPN